MNRNAQSFVRSVGQYSSTFGMALFLLCLLIGFGFLLSLFLDTKTVTVIISFIIACFLGVVLNSIEIIGGAFVMLISYTTYTALT